MGSLHAFNFRQWIDDNRALLKPPVGNKRVFADGDFVIMVVGGPNARKDYHVDPGEEFFYQLEGDMLLKTMQDGQAVDRARSARARCCCCRRCVPHSPQRAANTVGLVIERARRPGELDGFQWYCERCGQLPVRGILHAHGHREAVPAGVRALLRRPGASAPAATAAR